MEHYVEIQFGRFTARVDENGNWALASGSESLSGRQTRDLLSILEFASTGPLDYYTTNRAERFASAAVANLSFDAEIIANTMPIDPPVPNAIY